MPREAVRASYGQALPEKTETCFLSHKAVRFGSLVNMSEYAHREEL